MDLLSFRVIGSAAVSNTSWLKVGKGVNVLKTLDYQQAQILIKMLQTINPPYDLKLLTPFRDLPQYTSNQPYLKRIIAGKKTVALAIFAAQPQLVKVLSAIDPSLYEIDRIEFGRRRDHSRWLNFVELSNSTRWRELASTVEKLVSQCGQEAAADIGRLRNILAELGDTDRIKGEAAVDLKNQMAALRSYLPDTEQDLLEECLYAIDRAHRYRLAKERAANALPFFLSITKTTISDPAGKTDPALTVETGSAIFTFLAKHHKKGQAKGAPLQPLLDQVNLRLRTLHPELTLNLREAGATVILETLPGSTALPLARLPPVEEIEALLSSLAIMHEEILGCYPIFLIDINKMQITKQEQAELLNFLLCHSSHWQYLVIPDSAFLELCSRRSGEGADSRHSSITLIDVRQTR